MSLVCPFPTDFDQPSRIADTARCVQTSQMGRFALFTSVTALALSACSQEKSAFSADNRDEQKMVRNDLSEFEAEWNATGPHEDPQLESRLREAEEYQRWRERVRPTPKNAFPKIGTCYSARVAGISGRICDEPAEDCGTQVEFDNGLYQVSYGLVPEIVRSRRGDKVRMCVIDLPEDCPPGDFRGVVYRTSNSRTRGHWELPDSAHDCGGP
jgi:hypothetical protein